MIPTQKKRGLGSNRMNQKCPIKSGQLSRECQQHKAALSQFTAKNAKINANEHLSLKQLPRLSEVFLCYQIISTDKNQDTKISNRKNVP